MKINENTIFADRYQLLRLLGEGGFSEVWLASDTMTGLEVAVKIYAPGKGLDSDGIELFRKEFALVFNMNHTHLLKPSYYDVYNRMPFLIMPFCEQGSVYKLIGQINEDTAWHILHDVAAALVYLHSLKSCIIHQDIKPDNILTDSEGRFLVTDFGISTRIRSTLRRSVSDSHKSGSGTLAYMGAERFGSSPTPIMASDIWSLGATMFELMTGYTPFGEHGGLIQKSGADIPDIGGSWSGELTRIIMLCLEIETWDRPTAETLVRWCEKHFAQERIDFGKKTKPKKNKKQSKNNDTIKPDNGVSHKMKKPVLIILVCLLVVASALAICFDSHTTYSAEEEFQIAEDYRFGQNKKEMNLTKAIEWYGKAAEHGYAQAQWYMGFCCQEGNGVEQNHSEAAKWFLKAAEQQYSEAEYNLAYLYYFGRGIEQNYTKAVEWYRKSAEQGHDRAQNCLGVCYYYGQGIEQNYAKAVEWYQKSAEQGNSSAQYNLGSCYEKGEGVEQNYTNAIEWYQRSAGQENADAQCILGYFYHRGIVFAQSYSKAIEWYRKSAEQKNARAQNNLGACYENGQGVEKNYAKAVEWYRKSAEQGYGYAQYNLGICYEFGDGVRKSNTEAVQWYKKAAAQGHADATKRLKSLVSIQEN